MAANVKINANSTEFQKQMKQMTQELKKVASSYNLANTQAKLFGKENDVLKSKSEGLTNKIKIQNRMIETQSKHIGKLNSDLAKQKNKQTELADKIEKTNKKYQDSIEKTGKNSEETKKLAKELKELKSDYNKNNKEIDTNNNKLSNAQIKLNNSKKALLENKKALEEINKQLNKSKIDKFANNMENVGNKAEKVSNKMKPISVGIIGLGTASAYAGMKFEDGIANINTLLDDQSHLDSYKKKVIEISNQTGKNFEDISDGMYQCISTIGDGGKETESIFDTMAKSAKAGGAETQDAVSLIGAAMKGYNKVNNETAKQISDLAFETAKLGVTTFPEMASSMKPLFPLASTLNINMKELFGSMATLTGVTGNTSEVSTQMKAVFSNLIKPTTEMQSLIGKYGFKSGQAMLKQKGLIGVLKILQKETGGQSDKLGKLFSSTEALTAITALTGTQFGNMKTKTAEMNKCLGTTDKALKKINSTSGNDLRTSLNMAKNSIIEFGEILSPYISMGAKGLSTITKKLQGLSKGQKDFIVKASAMFIGTNLLLGGFAKLSKGIKGNIKFTKDLIKASKNGAKHIKDFAKATSTGVGKLAKFGKGIVSCVKAIGRFTLAILKNTATALKNVAIWTINKVKLLAYKSAQLAVTIATKGMTLAQKALNLVMKANPIGLVITLLLSLAVVFVTLYKKCDWFRNGVNKTWTKIKSIFSGFANFMKGAFTRDWTKSFGLLGVPLNSFFGTVKSIVDGVKGVFNGVITFFKGVFTGNWKQAFQGMADIVSSIFGTIGGVIKAPINAAISAINLAIRGINSISFTTPSWLPGGLGGKHFGVNLSEIPALATGGIVTKPTMALVGEGKENEAVIPLSKLDKLVTTSLKKALAKDNKKETVRQPINLIIDGKTVASVIVDQFGNVINRKSNSRAVARGVLV